MLTYHHLVNLYSLNNKVSLFRALLYFWQRDPAGHPLLALLCSFARDSVLRATTPFLLSMSEGETMNRQALENFINAQEPGRFSQGTLKSTARNIGSTDTVRAFKWPSTQNSPPSSTNCGQRGICPIPRLSHR